jgi:hypothetical protein
LAHAHVAAPDWRIPLPSHGEEEVRDLSLALDGAGYDDRVSAEARWSGIEEAATGSRRLREIWAAVESNDHCAAERLGVESTATWLPRQGSG